MKTLFGHIRRAARSDATVLIFGETGTGKDLVAQALHDYSRRSRGPMTPVNCGVLPKELIESELFGHRQGSFTGAVRDKPGLFEAISGGTLFLDEIGALSLDLQIRLLRVLQERKVRRVDETREHAVDVRIVAATYQPLEDLRGPLSPGERVLPGDSSTPGPAHGHSPSGTVLPGLLQPALGNQEDPFRKSPDPFESI